MENKKLYTIYKVKQYKKEFVNGSLIDYKCYSDSIENILKRLETNNAYHLMINKNNSCIMFGDLDHIP
jgi:hypothetical protein